MIKEAKPVNLPCCGVFAVFLATPEPEFDPVFKKSKHKLGFGDRWQGRMTWRQLLSLLKTFGIQHRDKSDGDSPVGLTVNSAIKRGYFTISRQYVIFISGHFFTLKDGKVYDQSHPLGLPLRDSKFGRRKIKNLAVIL